LLGGQGIAFKWDLAFNSRTPRTVCLCRISLVSNRNGILVILLSTAVRFVSIMSMAFLKSILYWWGKRLKWQGVKVTQEALHLEGILISDLR